ncbi:MAG: VWA domain-containing protein [Chloroflexia bacterium]|nr:VWA domain-containing protein [Chloroflexia bacterium]
MTTQRNGIRRLIALILLVSLSLTACGAFQAGDEPAPASTDAPTATAAADANPEMTPAAREEIYPVPGAESTSGAAPTVAQPTAATQPQPTGEVVATEPARATETPDTGQVAEKLYRELLSQFDAPTAPKSVSPEARYQQRLVEYSQNYSQCGQAGTRSQGSCPKPASLKKDLKKSINIEIILDASGSMQGDAGGERKINVARRVLAAFIRTLPDSANVALRVYGHKGSNSREDKALSCAGTELVYPFQKLNEQKFSKAVASFEARGWTPVAGALEKARQDFARFDPSTNSNFVYLVSDGIETCGGDPVAAARKLAGSDVGVEVNIVGFDVDGKAAKQLRAAATAGGGSYHDAAGASELERIFAGNYDWLEWTRYYNCRELNAYRDYNTLALAAYRNFNCISLKAYREYNNMSLDAYRASNSISQRENALYNKISLEVYNDARYEPYRDRILELAGQRRDSLIQASVQVRDHTLGKAKSKRDRLLSPTEDKRDDVLRAAEEERNSALEEVRKGRQKHAGDD